MLSTIIVTLTGTMRYRARVGGKRYFVRMRRGGGHPGLPDHRRLRENDQHLFGFPSEKRGRCDANAIYYHRHIGATDI